MTKPEAGAAGFPQKYWDDNYSEPHEMDGLANAAEHARYAKSFFDLDQVDIRSIIDFGFGLGHLFEEMVKTFMPYRAYALEPSAYAFKSFHKRYQKPAESVKLTMKQTDIVSWCHEQKPRSKYFDLGLCTSVFQYLSEDEIALALPVMAQKCKYLYFSVPTDKELERQVSELDFFDKYAKRRRQIFYRKQLKPHFSVIGARLLESKKHFNEHTTSFTDYLFRYD